MANQVPVSTTTYQNYELGSERIPAVELARLAEILSVDVGWFFLGVGNREAGIEPRNDKEAVDIICIADEREHRRVKATKERPS